MAISRENELGGLWLKTAKSGTKFMSGRLNINGEAIEVVVFKNTHKEQGDKKPDYRVYRSEPREGQPAQQPRPSIADDLDDEIPF